MARLTLASSGPWSWPLAKTMWPIACRVGWWETQGEELGHGVVMASKGPGQEKKGKRQEAMGQACDGADGAYFRSNTDVKSAGRMATLAMHHVDQRVANVSAA